MNRKQIMILWLSLSLLAPICYLGGKTLIRYNRDIESAKGGFIPDPYHEQPREYHLRVEKDEFVDVLGIGIFEILSISGLAIYWSQKKRGEG